MKKLFATLIITLNIFGFNNNKETADLLINQLKIAYTAAENNITDLPESIFNIEGMSSRKNRIFLNTLGKISHKIPTNYLEIGVWKGSTFVAANYKNKFLTSYCVDNWSEFEGPRTDFKKNLYRFYINNTVLFDTDCFSPSFLQKLKGKKFDIYFYDGNHKEINQYNAFIKLNPYLDDLFIAVVDDWSWPSVKNGTMKAFKELGYNIIEKLDINTDSTDKNGYWNGLLIALIQKAPFNNSTDSN